MRNRERLTRRCAAIFFVSIATAAMCIDASHAAEMMIAAKEAEAFERAVKAHDYDPRTTYYPPQSHLFRWHMKNGNAKDALSVYDDAIARYPYMNRRSFTKSDFLYPGSDDPIVQGIKKEKRWDIYFLLFGDYFKESAGAVWPEVYREIETGVEEYVEENKLAGKSWDAGTIPGQKLVLVMDAGNMMIASINKKGIAGKKTVLKIGVNNLGDENIWRALVRGELPKNLTAHAVKSAFLYLYYDTKKTDGWSSRDVPSPVTISKIVEPWDASCVAWEYRRPGEKWRQQGGYTEGAQIFAQGSIYDRIAISQIYIFDITDILQEWLVDPARNNGIMIKEADEHNRFKRSESDFFLIGKEHAPKLVIVVESAENPPLENVYRLTNGDEITCYVEGLYALSRNNVSDAVYYWSQTHNSDIKKQTELLRTLLHTK